MPALDWQTPEECFRSLFGQANAVAARTCELTINPGG
jgi:hypothetical protein